MKILCNLTAIDIDTHHITTLYKTIGENVKKIRKQQGISQLDLALAVGYKSVSSIAKAESLIEKKHFNIEQLYKISKALDVPIEKFFEGI
ncbi:helix-turn-helix domain-containing protein [Sulfurospirillum tamanense]|uniref:helix-turn-helix domain-containing protein n=1 Tax=Sulfurospirillum tamanense TaxID=2813362 RepID=UPI0034E1D097